LKVTNPDQPDELLDVDDPVLALLEQMRAANDRQVAEALDPRAASDRTSKETLDVRAGDADTRQGTALPPVELPETIGRFQIDRVLGQGGYGLVLLALDPTLKRQVALKIPRTGVLLTEELQQRFVREAEAAAALNHAHIVPVYEVGRSGPICYLAAAYCEGESLAERMQRVGRLEPHKAARLTATLAEAVQHAHNRGVLHRDLKPANILLTHDPAADGQQATHPTKLHWPMITDFGLARIEDDDQRMTASGSILGTPAYMAPEQASGDRSASGASADIYSLGAVLYELLTGQPPFQGATLMETLDAVRHTEPTPMRRQCVDIPRDLEAITLKCLEKQPSLRYGTCSEFAADLERFLAAEPVQARRATRVERVVRWCRRNPAISTMAATMILAAGVALVALSMLWRRSEAALELATIREAELLTRTKQLTGAINEMFSIAADSPEFKTPEAEPQRRRLLEQAEKVYDSVSHESATDPHLLFEQANAMFQVARVYGELGAYRESIEKANDCIQLVTRVSKTKSDIDAMEVDQQLGTLHVFKGLEYAVLNEFEASRESLDAGVDFLSKVPLGDEVVIEDDTSVQFFRQAALARALAQRASGAVRARQMQTALQSGQEALDAWQRLREPFPDGFRSHNIKYLYAHSLQTLGWVYEAAGKLEQSESVLRQAIEVADVLDSLQVSSQVAARSLHAECHHRLGIALARQHRLEEARDVYQRSIADFRALIDDFPDVPRYRDMLDGALYSLAATEYLSQNLELAEQLLLECVENLRGMQGSEPSSANYFSRIGNRFNLIYVIRSDRKDPLPHQMKAIDQSLDAIQTAMLTNPDWQWLKMALHRARGNRAGLMIEMKDYAAAEALLIESQSKMETLVAENPEWDESRRTLHLQHRYLARLYEQTDRADLAIENFETALRLVNDPTTKEVMLDFARALARVGRFSECEEQLRQCLGYVTEPQQIVDLAEHCLEIAADDTSSPTLRDFWRGMALNMLRQGHANLTDASDEVLRRIHESESIQAAFDESELALAGSKDSTER
jgi:tetratricopeptide (TPR) repeat protein